MSKFDCLVAHFDDAVRASWPSGYITRRSPGSKYSDCYTVQPRTGKVMDSDIAALVRKHTHWWQRLDTHFVCDCALEAIDILWGYVEPPKGRWFFGRNYHARWIDDDEWERRHPKTTKEES